MRKDFVPFVDADDTGVLRIKKVLLAIDEDVMFISVHLPPYDSSYWKLSPHGYGMEIIDKCFMDLRDITDDFYLVLYSDLNAQIASGKQVQDDYEDIFL